MRWNKVFDNRDLSEWHIWFAWYPIFLWDDNVWVWLENLEKRKYYSFESSTTDYRLMEKK